MLPYLVVHILLVSATAASPLASKLEDGAPRVTTKNGTLVGVHSPSYHQDFFLGVPFAQPPVGDLRFRNPQPINESWDGERAAQKLPPACVGYGDCLYLNVVRPTQVSRPEPLPVLVWIYGGGFIQGSAADLRNNLTFIIERSVALGQPIIGVTMNYRLSAWGFLASKELAEEADDSNFGLRDQRMSLEWIRDNIAAFGGDPARVTIWGESAGADSVARHMMAFDGRDDGLFRAGVMASGRFFADDKDMAAAQPTYDELVAQAGCHGAQGDSAVASTSSLSCLRAMPFEKLNAVINSSTALRTWGPMVDGDMIARSSHAQFLDGSYLKIPIIVGDNTAEGTAFAPKGINTTEQFRQFVLSSPSAIMNDAYAQRILDAYPARSPEDCLPNLPPTTRRRRTRTDRSSGASPRTMISDRRATCEAWARAGLPAYCYRFNAVPAWAGPLDGATHFVEVAFAMLNLEGVGYAPNHTPPFEGLGAAFRDLARLVASDWVAFVNGGDPNRWAGRADAAPALAGGKKVPEWPVYTHDAAGLSPRNFLYDANITSSVEDDTWRKVGMELIQAGQL
ncbi:uncharacterized protein PG998_000338 [Apiospora kogelbergensis]|uniref:uncharacterized protein n=1 Tax=Apiospora kogelbergensis TaxID=1337665 RepID=UPI0031310682